MIRLYCSICGYSNVYSLRNITDEKIAEIENVVRQDFAEMLTDAESESNACNIIGMHDVFGLYASNHERFRFLPGEKSLIDQIVLHVKSFESKDKKPCNEHFNMPEKFKLVKKNICCTPIGYLFGNKLNTEATVVSNQDQDTIEIPPKEDLICKLNSLLVTFDVTASDGMIIIRNNGRKVWADASCILCTMKDVKKSIRVQFDVSKTTKKPYWNISNFSKHLRNLHDDGNLHDGSESHKKRVKKEKTDETTIDSTNIAVKTEKINSIKHEPIILNGDLDSSIYTQISDQNLKLTRAIKTHNEVINSMEFKLDAAKRTVDVIEQSGDTGSCLYLALAHQIFACKVDSEYHKNEAQKLREEVVRHIMGNFDRYRNDIECRLKNLQRSQHFDSMSEDEKIKECKFYVSTILIKSWGGSESLRAISELQKVNILVFCEDDICYFPYDFNSKYERTVYIAFRFNRGKTDRNHYDSVAEVGRHLLYPTAMVLAKKELNRAEMKRNKDKIYEV